MHSILIQLDNHPEERDLIGKIILAYGVMEVALLEATSAALDGNLTTAMRVLFRLKSESNRLEVADALIRPRFTKHRLGDAWHDAYLAFKFCKGVRNTYAHSQWVSDEHGVLRFGDLDKAAQGHGEKGKIDMRPLTKGVLVKQFAYFTHAEHLILWATDQYQKKTGLPRKLPDGQFVIAPKRIPQPKLDSRGEAHSRQ
jgi:hypothetical protein